MTVAAGTYLDAASAASVRELLAAVDAEVPLVEAYVVGSAAVGAFDPRTSDVDLVAVVERQLGDARARLLRRLRSSERPGRDLELVVYVLGAQPPDHELNVSGGGERPCEPAHWFVIDAALAQEHAVPVWGDRPWSDFFDTVPEERLRAALHESLAWSARQPADDTFARLNAVRARHRLDHGEWISKAEATP